MTLNPRRTLRRGLAAGTMVLLIAGCSGPGLLAACSGPGAAPGAATTDQRSAFISCLRDNGVEVPASAGQTGPPNLGSVDREALKAALEACADLAPAGMPGGPFGG